MLRLKGSDAELVLQQPAEMRIGLSTLVDKLRDVFRGAPKLSLLFLLIALICALFAPLIAPYSPVATNPTNILQAPSLSKHLLGTDNQGRDILSRLIYGAQTSVKIGVLSVLLAGTVGTLIGLVSGVFRGWIDRILMRITDMFLALPYLMVALTVVSLLGSSITNVIPRASRRFSRRCSTGRHPWTLLHRQARRRRLPTAVHLPTGSPL